MKREPLGRLVAAVLMGALSGLWVHHDYIKWSTSGREAFIAHERVRFDRFMLSPHPTIVTVVEYIFLMLVSLGTYELLAAGFSRLFKYRSSNAGQ